MRTLTPPPCSLSPFSASLQLAKQLKQLRIIVEALVKGFSSITYISLILFLFFYVFAIVAMLIFKVCRVLRVRLAFLRAELSFASI